MRDVDAAYSPSIGSAPPRPLLIVLSHLRWDFVFQRPQHLLTRAARVFDVVFVEEPLFEGDKLCHRTLSRKNGVSVVQPLVPQGTPEHEVNFHLGDVVEEIAANTAGRALYLWYYTPLAYAFGHRIDADVVIFDKMDELSAFKFASPLTAMYENALLDRADIVFTGGASIHGTLDGRHDNSHCLPSSIDFAHFAEARSTRFSDPLDQAALPRPRIGYFGVIDERLNLALIAEVARLRPQWSLIMVGPTAKIDPSDLPNAPNIHWLGPKSYAALPEYLAHWDVGLMPFAINEATRFISPTKTPEFLAAGLPLMSTPIHDVVEPYGNTGLVEIAATAEAMVACGDALLAARAETYAETRRLAAVDAYLSGRSWDRTWIDMLALIRDCDPTISVRSGFSKARALAANSR